MFGCAGRRRGAAGPRKLRFFKFRPVCDRCQTYPMAKLSAAFCTKIDVFSTGRSSAALRPRGSSKGSLERSRRGPRDGATCAKIGRRAAAPGAKNRVLGTLLLSELEGGGLKLGGRRLRHREGEALAHTGTTFVWPCRPRSRTSEPSKTRQNQSWPGRRSTAAPSPLASAPEGLRSRGGGRRPRPRSGEECAHTQTPLSTGWGLWAPNGVGGKEQGA